MNVKLTNLFGTKSAQSKENKFFRTGIKNNLAPLNADTVSFRAKAEKSKIKSSYPEIPLLDSLTHCETGCVFWTSDLEKTAKKEKYQKEAGEYLDALLKQIEITGTTTKGQPIKLEEDYMLADGTIISRKTVGDEEILRDELGWPTQYSIPKNNKVILWIKDINGNEHIIPAFNKENCEKAQKIFDYVYNNLEKIPRSEIDKVQKEYLNKLNKN